MSNIIRLDYKIYHIDYTLNRTNRLVSGDFKRSPKTHEFGSQNFDEQVIDYLLFENVNFFILSSDMPIVLRIGDSSSDLNQLTNIKFFSYDGDPVDVQLTNENEEQVNIEYVIAKY